MKRFCVKVPVEGWEEYIVSAKDQKQAITKLEKGDFESVDHSKVGSDWVNDIYLVDEIK